MRFTGMEKRRLGQSDLLITPVGVGAWAMGGGGWAFAWGPQDDAQSIAAIRAALEAGWNWIDTAPVYGLGHSEEVVARALEGVAQRPLIFTKCAMVWDADRKISNRLKRESVALECEASLRRLRTDVIDLYQIHWPNPDPDLEEGWQALSELQKEGKVRWIGVSNFNAVQIMRLQSIAPVTSLQPPYSAIRRGVENGMLSFCEKENIGVIVYSPMQAGLLSGKMTKERVAALPEGDWRRNSKDFQQPDLTRNLLIQSKFADIGMRHGHTAAVAALAWVLRKREVTGAIVGARRPSQVDGFIAAMDFRLSEEELKEVDAFLPKPE
jgi:aryl-alcohol dehydrogenase-like predicted oxidoreductase